MSLDFDAFFLLTLFVFSLFTCAILGIACYLFRRSRPGPHQWHGMMPTAATGDDDRVPIYDYSRSESRRSDVALHELALDPHSDVYVPPDSDAEEM